METYRCLKCGAAIEVDTEWGNPDYYSRIPVKCPSCSTEHERYFDEVITEDDAWDCPGIELASGEAP